LTTDKISTFTVLDLTVQLWLLQDKHFSHWLPFQEGIKAHENIIFFTISSEK